MRRFTFVLLLGLFTHVWAETIDFPLNAIDEHSDLYTSPHARLVRLVANIRYENRNLSDIAEVTHRVTIPAAGVEHQVLLQIETDGVRAKIAKHKNNEDEYIGISFPLAAKDIVEKHVAFLMLITDVDYSKRLPSEFSKDVPDAIRRYLVPGKSSGGGSSEQTEIASLAATLSSKCPDDLCKVYRAYEYPAQHLRFEVQKSPLGAIPALRSGVGDCTEYAAIFVALTRAMGIPARQTALFNFAGSGTVKQPNHDAAEIYVAQLGWIPVDPNLGKGRYDLPEGFAKKSDTTILYKRGDSWTWSNSYSGTVSGFVAGLVDVGMLWTLSVLQEGSVQGILAGLSVEKGRH